MFFLWLVFTSNLISQTTWLKVKLKLVTLDIFCLAGSVQQAQQSTFLAEGPYCNL